MQRVRADFARSIYEQLGITATGPEQQAILDSEDRFVQISGGEQSGKSFATAAILLPNIVALPFLKPEEFLKENGEPKFDDRLDKPRSPHFMIFGPSYDKTSQEFEYLEEWLGDLDLLAEGNNKVSKPGTGRWRLVTKYGVVVQTHSLEIPTSVRSYVLEGAAVAEAGACLYDGVERINGRLITKRGFCVYSGTIELSQQWYVQWLLDGLHDNTRARRTFTLPLWTNRAIFPGGKDDPEIIRLKNTYPEDVYNMRVAAIPQPPRDRVVPEFTEDHIRHVDVPEDAAYEIWIDPGYSFGYAILFVAWWYSEDGTRRFHVVDELYEQQKDTLLMIELCRQNPAWGRVRRGVIDIAGKGHRDATQSALEVWNAHSGITLDYSYWTEDRLIERLRISANLGQITVEPGCDGLVAEMGLGEPIYPGMHHWRYPVDREHHVRAEKPEDKWNHALKAMGYGLLHHLGQVERVGKPKPWSRMKGKKKRSAAT